MYKESEHMLKDTLNTYTKLFGEESEEVTLVLKELGTAYMMTKQFNKSRFANPISGCMV